MVGLRPRSILPGLIKECKIIHLHQKGFKNLNVYKQCEPEGRWTYPSGSKSSEDRVFQLVADTCRMRSTCFDRMLSPKHMPAKTTAVADSVSMTIRNASAGFGWEVYGTADARHKAIPSAVTVIANGALWPPEAALIRTS